MKQLEPRIQPACAVSQPSPSTQNTSPCNCRAAVQCGSALFMLLLNGDARLSVVVPLANATSLAANAVADVALGERYRLRLLLPGVVLVAGGLLLCSSA